MSRIRKERGSIAGSEELQLWQTVRSHLRTLEKLQVASKSDLGTLEARRTRYVESHSWNSASAAAGERRDVLLAAYRQLEARHGEEQTEIDRTLEKLEVLLAVRDDGSSDIAGKRKKRKVEGEFTSPPFSASSRERQMSPLSTSENYGDTSAPSTDARKRSLTKTSSGSGGPGGAHRKSTSSFKDWEIGSSAPTSAAPGTSAAAKEHMDPARARREVLAHQLPLQKGRKVAFRQPNKNKAGPGAANGGTGIGPNGLSSSTRSGAGSAGIQAAAQVGQSRPEGVGAGGGAGGPEEDGETWIMATVIECINNDRNRYVVQDDEDAAMPKYNTTLKAIVPLPESLQTLPIEDYKMGTQVLGLYPDTSCFYRAVVRGGGPGLNGKITAKMLRRADEVLVTAYQLEFEDDDGAIRSVSANLVVERP